MESDDEYDIKKDAITHPEITDSSAEEDEDESDKQENEDPNFRKINIAKFYFVFEYVIERFYKLKKSAKEANK